jgi:hypothetical protein
VRLPDPEPEKKKRDRRGYVQPSRLAARAARENAKLESGKQPLPSAKIPFIPQGKKLSATEANTLNDPFIVAMTGNFEDLDTYLWTRQAKAGKSTGEQPIWTNLDEEELAAMTRVMMRWGQHNEIVAAGVRGVIESRDYIVVGTLFVPRVQKTVEIVRDTRLPKQPRIKKA